MNLALLAVVVSLLLLVLNHDEAPKDLHETLYDESIGDEAKEIVIHREGEDDVVLQQSNNRWKVVKPSEFVADKDKVQHLFTLLSENADSRYDIAGKDLARYGLDKDRLSVSFNGVKMIFGQLNEVTRKRYIRKGDKMYLVDETVSGLLEMGEDAFRIRPKPVLRPVETPK